MNENQMEELNKNLELIKSNLEKVNSEVSKLKSKFSDATKSMVSNANMARLAFFAVISEIKNVNEAFDTIIGIPDSKIVEKLNSFSKKAFDKEKIKDVKLPDVTAKLGLNPMIELGKGWGASLNSVFKTIYDTISNLFGSLGEKVSKVFSKIGKAIANSGVGKAVSKFASYASNSIGEVISFLGNKIGPRVSTIRDVISSNIAKVMDMPIVKKVLKIINVIITNIQALFGAIAASPVLIMTAITLVIALIIGAIDQLWQTNEEFRTILTDAFNNIMATLTALWENIIKPIFEAIIDICINVFEVGIKPLWEAWVEFVGIVVMVLANLWNQISPIFNQILEVIGPIFTDALSVLSVCFSSIFTGILNVVTVVMSAVGGVLVGVITKFDVVFKNLKMVLKGIIDFLTGAFARDWAVAWEGIKNAFGGIFSGLVELLKVPLNAAIGVINGAIRGINKIKFDIPDWVPVFGGKTFEPALGEIPYLAQGGIASRATLGVFGEAGTEAIIPLKRNTQGIEMIANKLLENMPINNGNGTYMIQLVLEDGTVLAKKLIKNIKDYEVMTGKPAF